VRISKDITIAANFIHGRHLHLAQNSHTVRNAIMHEKECKGGAADQVDRDSFSQSSAGTIRFFATFTIKRQVRGSARLQRTARAKPAKRAGLAATCRSSHLGIPRPAPHSSQRRKHYVDGELARH
jgi:hypothetical protein